MSKYPRVTAALATRVWAMTPDKLAEVSLFVETLVAGGQTNFQAMATPAGSEPATATYRNEGGVAVIRIDGIIERRANMVTNFSGGVSTQMIAAAITTASLDPDITGIVLDIDSPGGAAMAPEEVAQAVRQAKEYKPVIAWTGGQMCSAAYWIGSSADLIVAMPTSIVGSIGVAAVHYDRSEADSKEGVTRTVFSAGKYKRIASDEKPLTEEGRAYLQGQVDRYFTLFVDAVAEHRGMTTDSVLETLADGSIHIGTDALDTGLVDRIGNFQLALELAGEKRRNTMTKDTPARPAKADASGSLSGVTLEQLRTERPDLCTAIENEAVAAATEEIAAKAAANERARVVEILEADGDPAATLTAIKDGTPTADVYKSFYQASKDKQSAAYGDLKNSLEKDVAGAAGAEKPKGDTGPDFMTLVDDYQKEHGCTRTQALSACAAAHPETHKACLASQK